MNKNKTGILTLRILVFFLVFLSLVVGLFVIKMCKHINDKKYDVLIIKYARQYSIDPNLIKSVIWKESNFNSEVEGARGEIGLMQIISSASVRDWATYNKRPIPPRGLLFSPDININIGTWYLAKCKSHWIGYRDGLALTLGEYNAGYTNAKKWVPENINGDVVERISFPSTKNYVIDILRKYEEYKITKDLNDFDKN